MSLKEVQQNQGAIFDDLGIPLSFNNDSEVMEVIDKGVAVCDRSHWGIIKITGEDRLRYLHNQSTNDFEKLKVGQGCDTVFVTSTARTLDLATAYLIEDGVIVIVSPNRREKLLAWLDKFIFPFDKVKLEDVSQKYSLFSLLGNSSTELLSQISQDNIDLEKPASHQIVTIAEIPVRLALGSGLATPGYNLIIEKEKAEIIWSKIIASAAIPFGDDLWEKLRIQQGRPKSGIELTEDYNPLEAGLWHTISFDKGCYIGQETIARLNTYNGIKQKLWGIELEKYVTPLTPITLEKNKIGILTSCTHTENGYFGLGYIRTKAGGEGLKVFVGDVLGKVISVPYISH